MTDQRSPCLIVGLGNPGAKYEQTRHNCGFLALDALQQGYKGLPDFSPFQLNGTSLISIGKQAQGPLQERTIYLQKPQTFMNLSGSEVHRLMRYYKIPMDQLLVIHDDIDLPFGDVRLKNGGGTGGHNGLKSLIAHIGPLFWRLRIGISHPSENVADYVLSRFSKEEGLQLGYILDFIVTSFHLWLDNQPMDFIETIRQKCSTL